MSTAAAGSSMVPSTQRPIPLQVREDLVVRRIEYQGIGYWVIKDPVGLKYYRLQPEQYHVLQLLDSQRNIEDIRDGLQKFLPTVRLQLTDIQHLITDLHQKGLVFSKRAGQGKSLLKHHREERKKKMFAAARNLLYLRLPGWDPESTLQRFYPMVSWVFRPWAVTLCMVLVVASWILLGIQFDHFRSQLPEFQQFFGWPNLMYMWVTLAMAKILHEFGHGMSCKHFGGECHEMGIMLLVFSPTLYCDVSDSWMLKSKWQRIIIGGGGMYVEVILSAIAVFVWWNTTPGLIHHLCLNVFFVTTITTVVFNANPLMRFDGYYMLSDLLEIPNLRPKADRLLRESFSWYCLGIESRPDPFMPETGRFWFVTYAIAAAIYRWVILFGITIFLYTVLKPYGLQSIGIAMAVVSISTIIGNLIYQVYKIVTAPRIEPMSKPKIAATVVVTLTVITAALTIPLPLHVEAALIVEPHEVQHVYTTTPGELQSLFVEPGQVVSEGAPLAQLSNPEMEDQSALMKIEKEVQTKRVDLYFHLEDPAQQQLAREKLQTVEEQLLDFEEQLAALRLNAPCDGIVVAPPRKAEPKLDTTKTQLSSWHGTPMDPNNTFSQLEQGTHLLSVAPNSNYQATMLIDQADRNDVFTGQMVELKFDHLPNRTYIGKVEQISERDLQFVPEIMSNKLGGALPTVTDSQGREKLASPAYQATVILDEDTDLFKSGIRGKARFDVAHRSAAQWIWRYLRQTFHFRL